jgi:O-antigen/teichoic acid export membrane protein
MIFDRIKYFIIQGDKRSSNVKKNIIAIFFIKGIGIIINLLYVPITLNYLNNTRYGIWMTITSILSWIGIFDIGLGNGLRNKLSEALTIKDYVNAKKYVSTTYAMLSSIVFIILLVFFGINHLIDWTKVLNTTPNYANELNKLMLVITFFFGIKFILNIISIVFIADQKPAFGSIFELIGNSISLIIVWILTLTGQTSLILFGTVIMFIPVCVYFIASCYCYNKQYKFLKPSLRSIDISSIKSLTSLGIQFFIIQIAVLIIFQTGNILIAQFFSPAEVTPYNIVFKYFSVLTMIWGIVLSPLWSAFTQAQALNDYKWMRRTLKKLNKMLLASIFILLIMSILARPVIKIWTGDKVLVNTQMIWIFALYTLISIWNNIYAIFLNGISKINIQIITSIIASIINIPLAFVFVKACKMGSEGIVLAMTISLSLFAFAGPIQTYKTLNKWITN